MQSLTRALVVFLGSIILGVYAGLIAMAFAIPYRADLMRPFIIASCAVASFALMYGLRWWAEQETDGKPRKPSTPQLVKIEHRENNGRTLRYEDCPASLDQLRTIATRLYYGGAFSHAEMEDVFDDRAAYVAFRGWMIQRGYAAWRSPTNPQSGVMVTETGNSFFGKFYSPPSPTAIVYAQDAELPVSHTPTHHE